MNKYALLIPLFLVFFVSCKQIKIIKGPDGKSSICTSSIPIPGVGIASKESPAAQCIVLSCENNYSKYDIQSFLNKYEADRNECLTNMFPDNPYFCPEEVSAEIKQYVSDYPKICTPSSQECEREGVIEGQAESPWVGLDNIRFRNYGANASENPQIQEGRSFEEGSPEDLLRAGYGECQPKNEESCREGYVFSVYNYREDRGSTQSNAMTNQSIVKRCMPEQQSCYFNESSNIEEYVQTFNPETQEYGQCSVLSCRDGYEVVNNSCQAIVVDQCLLNPNSIGCPGFNICTIQPMMQGCPGYIPPLCTIMPMTPGCPGYFNDDDN